MLFNVFIYVFYRFFYKSEKARFYVFYLQISVFNIYGLID